MSLLLSGRLCGSSMIRWCFIARRASTGAGTASALKTTVGSFSDIAPWLKKFLLRVHPDIVQSHGKEVVSVNQASLQEVLRLFDGIKSQCADGNDDAPSAPPPALKNRYDLPFYVPSAATASRNPGDVDANSLVRRGLARVTITLPVPKQFSERVVLLVQRGLRQDARAHWLELGRTSLQKLLAAAGVPGADGLQLAEEPAAIIRAATTRARDGEAERQKRKERAAPVHLPGALEALRANLVAHSPLLQGKGSEAFPSLSTTGGNSVFTLKQRKSRVEVILGRPDRASAASDVPASDAADAFRRLSAALVRHFDGLQVYHAVWPSLSLVVVRGGGGIDGWYADAGTRQLRIPHDFGEPELVAFLQRHLPRIIDAAMARVSREGAAVAAAKARKAAAEGRAPAPGENGGPRTKPPRKSPYV